MKLYRYVDQHWGQDLSVTDEVVSGFSGFPESAITQFLSFLALFAGATAIWTNPTTIGSLALTLFFLVMSLAYAYGRHTRIDRDNKQVTFTQSFFGIPFASESDELEAIRRDEIPGWIRNSSLIVATTSGGNQFPLFQGSSPGQEKSLESHWKSLTEQCPELIVDDQA